MLNCPFLCSEINQDTFSLDGHKHFNILTAVICSQAAAIAP